MTASNKIEILCQITEGEDAGLPMVMTIDAGHAELYEVGARFCREDDPAVVRFEVLAHRPAA